MASPLPLKNPSEPSWYPSLMELIPDIVYVVDPDGTFSYVNEAIRILGYEPEELIGKHFNELIHDEDITRVSRNHVLPSFVGKKTGDTNAPKLFDERRTGARSTNRLEVRLKTNRKTNNVSFQCLYAQVNSSGYYQKREKKPSFMGTIGVIQDVTERKNAEVQFKHLEAQLYQAQKMEVLGQLAGGIAHDFNNMLSGITGYAEIIRRENQDETGDIKDKRLARHIETVINASKRASELSRKLLAFSRQGKYKIEAVDVHQSIKESVSLLERTIDRRVRIVKKLDASHSFIMGDYAQVQNAILNLAMNARDAMPQGGTLTISTFLDEIEEHKGPIQTRSSRLTPGTYVVVEVKDTGMGMDREVQKKIFDPFFTTKPEGKGTGLGLASVLSTMKNHLGEIFVRSNPGKGTSFRLYFPAQNVPLSIPGKQSPESVHQRGQGNILVVDDEKMVRDLLMHMLCEVGYSVVTCENGLQARDYFSAHREAIDLVMLDVNMPVMNGVDCLRELRAIDPQVRTIVMTGYAVSEDTKKILTTGVSGFLQKPFEYRLLIKMIKEIITSSSK